MRALAYIRVSTDDQLGNGNSPDVQRERIRAYAALYGITLVGEVADLDVSSGVPLARRKGGAELTRRLIAGEASGVVVTDLDRLFRDALEGLAFFRWVDDHELAVHSVCDRIDTSSPEGKLALGIKLCAAQYERDKTRQRTLATMAYLQQQGRVRGAVPYGCVDRVAGKRGNGKAIRMLERCPVTWPLREQIVALYRTGRTFRGKPFSLRSLSLELSERKVAAPQGGSAWPLASLKCLLDTHEQLAVLPMAAERTPAALAPV